MKCSKCGNEVVQNSSFCSVCGNPVNPGVMPPPPPPVPPMPNAPVTINTWLIPAILATVFCCLPFGIVSIVFASRANSALGVGNYQLAQMNAEKAKTWFWVAFSVGIVTSIISIIVQIIAAVAASH